MGGRFHVVGGFVCHNEQTILPPRHCGEKIGLQLFFLARPKFFLFFFQIFFDQRICRSKRPANAALTALATISGKEAYGIVCTSLRSTNQLVIAL
jgi:hypothetical protein